MTESDYLIVGSGGGGGTIAWMLAKAGYRVTVLEQGPDWSHNVERDSKVFNPVPHDEELYRLRRPDPKRRLRGSYATFRQGDQSEAQPFKGGWTGTQVGGGTVIWGTWGLRPLPLDLALNSLYSERGKGLAAAGEILKEYAVEDWPVEYREMAPFFNVAEAILGVSGSREQVQESILRSNWFRELEQSGADWSVDFPFPCPPMPETPVGRLCGHMLETSGFSSVPLPVSIVTPGSSPYSTRQALTQALSHWTEREGFWSQAPEALWSERVRQACNQCGFCGEYLCWGREAPKAGMQATTLREMAFDLAENSRTIPNSLVHEILWAGQGESKRAVGVRYLDISEPDQPRQREARAKNVILSCGAVQSARLLQMSRYDDDNVGRYAMFHMFGLGAKFLLDKKFTGLIRGEFGTTGNTTTFDTYFIPEGENSDRLVKAGILTSTARKNPLESAAGNWAGGTSGQDLLNSMEANSRTVELRMNGDDLPHRENRVELDERFVDEYGLPVTRITRDVRRHEKLLNSAGQFLLNEIIKEQIKSGVIEKNLGVSAAVPSLIGDHQMGTCRMGKNPETSVLDRWCRARKARNLYVVDTSCFTTGFGVNPMVTVVANALRVGTAIIKGHGEIPD